MSFGASTFGKDFGQKVDLTASIRGILRNYPEGTSVLKELVQNADDAGARTVVFTLDCRENSTTTVADPALASFQGPALHVFNDAIFTDEDFRSIQRIGDSLKRTADSKAKIGRFGIGFNAVYHWTDLPSFVSSKFLVMLDPQARFLPNVNPSNPGKMVDWVSNQSVLAEFHDQFAPYEGYGGLDWSRPFQGTLFRLPLRTAEQAQTSTLSRRALSVAEGIELLRSLQTEASAMLLFLKSVENIDIQIWHQNSDRPESLFRSGITNPTMELRKKRAFVGDVTAEAESVAITNGGAGAGPGKLSTSGTTSTAGVRIITADYTLMLTCQEAEKAPYEEHWEVCNQLGGRSASAIADNPANALLRLVPWGGLAACISNPPKTTGDSKESGALEEDDSYPTKGGASQLRAVRAGLAYCFLPLPVQTGLPVMVNGFFELSSNRRDVWQAGGPGAEMTGDGRTRAEWNISLMRDVIGPSYVRLLLRLKALLGFNKIFQSLWPSHLAPAPWSNIVSATMHACRHEKLLYVANCSEEITSSAVVGRVSRAELQDQAKGGESAASTAAAATSGFGGAFNMLSSLLGSTIDVITKPSAQKHPFANSWIECDKAVLLPTTNSIGRALTSEQELQLGVYLLQADQPFVHCVPQLRDTLSNLGTCTNLATPRLVRTILRMAVSDPTGTQDNRIISHFIPPPVMCTFLINYCISDLKVDDLKDCQQLNMLPILPLSSGATGVVQVLTPQQAEALSNVCAMGFSVSRAIWGLSKSNFDVMLACDMLTSAAEQTAARTNTKAQVVGTQVIEEDNQDGIFVLAGEEVGAVFRGAADLLVDSSKIQPNDLDFLNHKNMQRLSNVRPFQASLVTDLLRRIMPPMCFGGKEVDVQDEALKTFISAFWRFSASKADVISAVAEGPALVPTLPPQEGFSGSVVGDVTQVSSSLRLRLAPLSRLSALLVPEKAEQTLANSLQTTLQVLGVQLVDVSSLGLSDSGLMAKVFWQYVQGPSRAGILAALDAAMRASISSVRSSTGAGAGAGAGSGGWIGAANSLSTTQREELRSHLASCEAVKNLTDPDCAILRQLPIFTTFALEEFYFPIGSRVGSSNMKTQPPPSQAAKLTMHPDLTHITAIWGNAALTRPFITLANRGNLPDKLFAPYVVRQTCPQDLQLLERLGVTPLRRSEFFRKELLPNIERLFESFPNDALKGIIEMLEELKTLKEEDRDFIGQLNNIKFIPSASCENLLVMQPSPSPATLTAAAPAMESPSSSNLIALHRPCELFDPQNVELVALLDPSFFPAHALQREDLLVYLRSAGLAQSLDWPAVIACARSIANGVNGLVEASEAAQSSCRRGHHLLRFLDKNISQLLGEDNKKPQQSAFSIFSSGIRTLFGEKPTEATLPLEVYLQDLVTIPWVPAMVAPLHRCMPWPWSQKPSSDAGTDAVYSLSAPLDIRPHNEAWLCSASKRLVLPLSGDSRDYDKPLSISLSLRKSLGWAEPLDVHTLAIQLREVAKAFLKLREEGIAEGGATASSSASSTVGSEGHIMLQDARELITGLIPLLYQKLNADADTEDSRAQLLAVLQAHQWIWVGETFVSADRVAITTSVNATPYLYQLPQDLQVYGKLLKVFHVKTAFTPRDYIEVLRQMAEDTGAASSPTQVHKATAGDSKGSTVSVTPLSDANVDLAVSLVTLLSAEGSINPHVHTIYVPDSTGRLALSTELVNDDVPWLAGPEYASVRVGCRLIHPNISSLVAEKLGVKSLRLTLVNQNAEQNLFAMPPSAVEAFGQAESLTSRLKTILDLYPEGNPIFSELIQNADDAGASSVYIMLDENSYPTESLLDSKMSPLQGPALIFANDAMFTEADYRSLARIGQGSKLEKLASTGRFGLGFSSTYHLTDTPTFVSGDYLVIFDPHCAFAPGANLNQPGLRIRFQGSKLPSGFPHQFEPFKHFGCTFSETYQGTLFRFPLRTAPLARRSEISKRSYTPADVRSNLEQLAGQLSNHLLFLRSVRKIEIYTCPAGERKPTLLHRAVSSLAKTEARNDQSLLQFFDKTPSGVPPPRDVFYRKLLVTPDDKLPLLSFEMKIYTERFSSVEFEVPRPAGDNLSHKPNDADGPPPSEIALVRSRSVEGMIASRRQTCQRQCLAQQEEATYIIVTGLRGGKAKAMACDEATRHLKLVPMGAVAACVSCYEWMPSAEQQKELLLPQEISPSKMTIFPLHYDLTESPLFPPINGQAFCFLPLPVRTMLPVHLNAYWELSSNRRDIWRGDDTTGEARLRSDWNMCVMVDVLAPLYAELLVRACALCATICSAQTHVSGSQLRLNSSPYNLLALLPCPVPQDPWRTVALSLLPMLRTQRLLFSGLGGGQFLEMQSAYLLEEHSATVKDVDKGANSVATSNNHGTSTATERARLEELLLLEGIPVVTAPVKLIKVLLDADVVAGEVSPKLVRHHFSSRANHCAVASSEKRTTSEAMSNAIFLLQYCFKDITRATYSSLRGLAILPLEDGSLGTINDRSSASLFLVTESERKLLLRAGSWIVASDTILGQSVANCLRDEEFSRSCNIRSLAPGDLLNILKTFIPSQWYNSHVSEVIDRTGIVSNDWLVGLWTYLIDMNALALFEGVFPMLPVIRPFELPPGDYVAKISKDVPVLHMTYKDMPSAAAAALTNLGIYTFDPAILGGISYSEPLGRLLCDPSPKGVVRALAVACGEVDAGQPASVAQTVANAGNGSSQRKLLARKKMLTWPADIRRGLRNFILDALLSKVASEGLSAKDCSVICHLPIWERHRSFHSLEVPASGNDVGYFCAIQTDDPNATLSSDFLTYLQLPPKGVDPNLLGPAFLKIRGDRDRPLYSLLGVTEPSKGTFFAANILPQIVDGGIEGARADALAVELLRNLAQLEGEQQGLSAMLSECPLFRSSGAQGTLKSPKQLYDPHAPHLMELLPEDVFPSPELFGDHSLLLSLRSLGLNTTITCDGILKAALAVQAVSNPANSRAVDMFLATGSSNIPPDSGAVSENVQAEKEAQLQVAIKRAKGLMQYLEANVEVILQEADPDGLRRSLDQRQTGASTSVDADAAHRILGGGWSRELRAISWVPVMTQPPKGFAAMLPWSQRVHVAPVAAPSQCVHLRDIYLCTATSRICSIEVKNDLVRELLGWERPISGRVAAIQLLQMKDAMDQANLPATASIPGRAHPLVEAYYHFVPQVFMSLSAAYERETSREVEVWMRLLRDKGVLWVNGRFVKSERVAFSSPLSSVNLEPYLYLVQGELQKHKVLLAALGVQECFGPQDLVMVTRDLCNEYHETPMPAGRLEVCLGVLKLLVRYLRGEDDEEQDETTETAESADNIDPPSAEADAANEDDDDCLRNVGSTRAKRDASHPPVILDDLLPIFLPDHNGVMMPSTALTFDDAPWVSATFSQRNTAIKFVHRSIDTADAKTLGAKSLREQLFSGDGIMCPEPMQVQSMLANDAVTDTLTDLLALADDLGASSIHVVLDSRTHPGESLMHPGLTEAQGPALVVFIEGPALTSESVCQIISPPVILPPNIEEKSPFAEAENISSVHHLSKEEKMYPQTGKRLLSAFAVTDCLQLITGNEFIIFDPCGQYLLSIGDDPTLPPSGPVGVKTRNNRKSAGSKGGGSIPSGSSTASFPTSVQASPRAQRCFLVGGGRGANRTSSQVQDVLTRFPDQFFPFMSLPFRVQNSLTDLHRLNGVLIRMPLRRTPSVISPYVASEDDIKGALRYFRSSIEGALIFGSTLNRGVAAHWQPHAEKIELDFDMNLVTSVSKRNERKQLLGDKSWSRSSIVTLFSKAFVPPEMDYMITISSVVTGDWSAPSVEGETIISEEDGIGWLNWRRSDIPAATAAATAAVTGGGAVAAANGSTAGPTPTTSAVKVVTKSPAQGPQVVFEDNYLLYSILGATALRDIALKEPFRSLRLQPFVTLAVRLCSNRELSQIASPISNGLICCSAGHIMDSGLPFHIEAPFIQDLCDRTLSLPLAAEAAGVLGSFTTSGYSGGASVSRGCSPYLRMLSQRLGRQGVQLCLNAAEIQIWNAALLTTALETLTTRALISTCRRLFPLGLPGASTRAGVTGSRQDVKADPECYYKYWPYLPRLPAQIANIVKQKSRLLEQLSAEQLFLTSTGFFALQDVVLPVHTLSRDVMTFLQRSTPIAMTPIQVAKDLKSAKIKFDALTPDKLRDRLKKDAVSHCSCLRNRYELLLPLLRYASLDFEHVKNEGEFTRKKAYGELSGCPLLPMADGSVRTFPRSNQARVIQASVALHALLPQLAGQFIHPTALNVIAVSRDPCFADKLYIENFSASSLQETIWAIAPTAWRRCQAVHWIDEGTALTTNGSGAGRGLSTGPSVGATSVPSELLIYVLWRDALAAENAFALDSIADWPLLPVVSRGRRLLLSPSLITAVFDVPPTSAQDNRRAHFHREAGRLASLVLSEANAQVKRAEEGLSRDNYIDEMAWSWTSKKVVTVKPSRQTGPIAAEQSVNVSQPNDSTSAVADLSTSSAPGSEDFSRREDGVLGTLDAAEAMLGMVTNAATAALQAAMAPHAVSDSNAAPADASEANGGGLSAPPAELLEVMSKLGVPVLDAAVFDDLPAALQSVKAHLRTTMDAHAVLGRRLLECMYTFHQRNAIVFRTVKSTTPGDPITVEEEGSLLSIDTLTTEERHLLLKEILKSHRIQRLSDAEIDKLKALRLFTLHRRAEQGVSTPSARSLAIAIAECSGGIFWCSNSAVLEGVKLPGDSDTSPTIGRTEVAASSTTTPVILEYESSLVDLYSVVGAVELTPSAAVRRFTLPSLSRMSGPDRLIAMRGLAERWSAYKSDAELTQTLKAVAFVPAWDSSGTSVTSEAAASASAITTSSTLVVNTLPHCHYGEERTQYRTAAEVLSWNNTALLDALRGQHQSRYFAPPELRDNAMHQMLTDLGMASELTAESLLKIAKDIEASAAIDCSATSHNQSINTRGETETTIAIPLESEALRDARDRGRRLLQYLKEGDRTSGLFNSDLCRKLAKISFVPIQIPAFVQIGGHVAYRPALSRFDQLLYFQSGALGFTVMPLLEEHIAPPQIFSSSLGVTTSPSIEVVLRHLRNLTSCGDSLDRWNTSQFSLRATFAALFQYLHDHWRDVSGNVKTALRSSQLVPVGHYLVRPSRLFFRLPGDDLAPFMHEVPRYFGAHEQFLKELGVREQPSADDYVLFLSDLALESHGAALNPNELRAVVAIVQAVAARYEEEVEAESRAMQWEESLLDKSIFVPDDGSRLRDASLCLANDDEWQSVRAGGGVRSVGLHILHPSIGLTAASQLGIPKISEVLVERLATGPDGDESTWCPEGSTDETELQSRFGASLRSHELISAIAALCVKATSVSVSPSALSLPSTATAASSERSQRAVDRHLEGGVSLISEKLHGLRLRFVTSLPVKLVLRDPRRTASADIEIAEMGRMGGAQSLLYIRDDTAASATATAAGGGGLYSRTMFINSTMLAAPAPITAEVAMSLGLCRLLGLDASLAAALACLLCAPPGQRSEVLSALRVGSDPTTVTERLRGLPGEVVTATDRRLLELKPFRIFRSGEIVAYESNDSDSGRGKVMRYGRVLTAGEGGDVGVRKVTVKITSDNAVPLLATEIFSFKSAREAAAEGVGEQTVVGSILGAVATGIGNLVGATQLAGSTNAPPPPPPTDANDADQPVGHEEVMRALNSLLMRAGLPLAPQEQTLMSRVIELDALNKRLQADVQQERAQLVDARDALSKATGAFRCQICVAENVSHVMVPCGHVICGSCVRSLQRNNCPFCRRTIQQKVHFFAPGQEDDSVTL